MVKCIFTKYFTISKIVEVRDSSYVADFHIKLTEMIDLNGSECFAEFHKKIFYFCWGKGGS